LPGRRSRSTGASSCTTAWPKATASACSRSTPAAPPTAAACARGDIVLGLDGAALGSVDALHQSLNEARIHKDCAIKLLRGHASPQVMFLSLRPIERIG
jgi:S1-C subfamily serine protease